MAQAVTTKLAKRWVKEAGRLSKSSGKARKVSRGDPVATRAATPAAAAPKADLKISAMTHEPASFRSGQKVQSSVNVTNRGQAAASVKLRLYVNEAIADSKAVNVKPGATRQATFKWTAQEKNKLNIRGEMT